MSDTAKRMAELHSESVSSLTAAFRPLIVRSGVLNEEEADKMCEVSTSSGETTHSKGNAQALFN